MYIFTNQSDDSLANLSAAVYAEQRRRILAKIESYPTPLPCINDSGGFNLIGTIKEYRETHGCSLMQAKLIVEHHLNKE
jgi:ribosomal protein L7/L12